MISYFKWLEFKYYLDNFIHIVPAILATPFYLKSHKKGYRHLTDCLRILRQEAKNYIGTVVPVFDIEIDTNLMVAQIPAKKLQKTWEITEEALSKESFTLHEDQPLNGFLSFYAQLVQLGWVFMRKLWDFVASYPIKSLQFLKQKISSEVQVDLQ